MKPTLFLSHGAPTLALSHAPAADFLRGLPGLLPSRPTAIIAAEFTYQEWQPGDTAQPFVEECLENFAAFLDICFHYVGLRF